MSYIFTDKEVDLKLPKKLSSPFTSYQEIEKWKTKKLFIKDIFSSVNIIILFALFFTGGIMYRFFFNRSHELLLNVLPGITLGFVLSLILERYRRNEKLIWKQAEDYKTIITLADFRKELVYNCSFLVFICPEEDYIHIKYVTLGGEVKETLIFSKVKVEKDIQIKKPYLNLGTMQLLLPVEDCEYAEL